MVISGNRTKIRVIIQIRLVLTFPEGKWKQKNDYKYMATTGLVLNSVNLLLLQSSREERGMTVIYVLNALFAVN